MTEQQQYEVERSLDGAELRRYSRCTVADVTITGTAEQAGNRAFGPLVRYISAKNLAMTAPVLQAEGDQVGEWVVSFVLPGGKALSDYPLPEDAQVTLREIPEHLAMAARWAGRWNFVGVEQHTQALRSAIREAGLIETGTPVWARYDPPWKPWFLRRNEVIIPVEPATTPA